MSTTRTATHLPPHATQARQPRTWLWTVLALLLIGSAAAALSADFLARVRQERELIAAGKRIQEAISAYHQASPGTAKTYPNALQHLLMDPRMLAEKKYLDYIPTDPLTRKNEWAAIKNANGEVIGVHSLASGSPSWLGQLLAPSGSGHASYAEWRFVHNP
jgi:type II secretory pathway pseudopilin PulG